MVALFSSAAGAFGPDAASSSLAGLLGQPVGAEELAGQRARGTPEDLPVMNRADAGGNTATGNTTGNASMTDSVRSNSGFTTVFQNTGNNVLLQSSTIVNITVR
jgi:hypothetical protein